MLERRLLLAALSSSFALGCFTLAPSQGGGEVEDAERRRPNPNDVALTDGYTIDVVAVGLTFPTDVVFDDQRRLHVVEAGYSYGEKFTAGRLLRLEPNGAWRTIAEGRNGPWNGAVFHEGAFYISEGGQLEGGRIIRITPDGARTVVVEGLPGRADHHTNRPAIGRDGYIYFGQGVATNSGIVGEDNAKFGWLRRFPDQHDIPCADVTLTGKNYETSDVVRGTNARVMTGAYVPFGTTTRPDQVIAGSLPCTGAIMRVRASGGALELVAWGLRNPYGLAFDAQGILYATDNGADERGSRPIYGSADVLWRIEQGAWYGWPDFSEGRPVDQERYASPPGQKAPARLLAKHPGTPPKPAAYLAVHASANGLDFSTNPSFGFVGEAFVAIFGDMAPNVGKVLSPVGFKVVRVDVRTGVIRDFAVNRSEKEGPASRVESGGLERPIAARFDPDRTSLYVTDFGVLTVGDDGKVNAREGTGVVWRIRPRGVQ